MATLTLQDWTARAAALFPEGRAFIAGAFSPAADGKTYNEFNANSKSKPHSGWQADRVGVGCNALLLVALGLG